MQTWTTTACAMQIQHYHERREQQTSSEGREASQAQPESYPTHNFQLWREGKGRTFTSFSTYLQMRKCHISAVSTGYWAFLNYELSPAISFHLLRGGEALPFPLSAGPISFVVACPTC